MTRRRGFSLLEAVVAIALLAIVATVAAEAFGTSAQAGMRMALGGQARRLLEQDVEQIRSGLGIPAAGTVGPLTVSVTQQAAAIPTLSPQPPLNTPSCPGCSSAVTTSGVSSLTQVTITITDTTDGTVLASGTTVTPP